jgi:hypothetical protein
MNITKHFVTVGKRQVHYLRAGPDRRWPCCTHHPAQLVRDIVWSPKAWQVAPQRKLVSEEIERRRIW